MWTQYQCRLCGGIIHDHRQRRILQSEANNRTRLVLQELLASRVPDRIAIELLLPVDPSTPGLSHSYICKQPCFASLEKLLKTKEKVAQLTDEIKATEKAILRQLEGLYHFETESDGAQTPQSKRPRLHDTGGSTPVARRGLHFATEPGKSPGVLVCFTCIIII